MDNDATPAKDDDYACVLDVKDAPAPVSAEPPMSADARNIYDLQFATRYATPVMAVGSVMAMQICAASQGIKDYSATNLLFAGALGMMFGTASRHVGKNTAASHIANVLAAPALVLSTAQLCNDMSGTPGDLLRTFLKATCIAGVAIVAGLSVSDLTVRARDRLRAKPPVNAV